MGSAGQPVVGRLPGIEQRERFVGTFDQSIGRGSAANPGVDKHCASKMVAAIPIALRAIAVLLEGDASLASLITDVVRHVDIDQLSARHVPLRIPPAPCHGRAACLRCSRRHLAPHNETEQIRRTVHMPEPSARGSALEVLLAFLKLGLRFRRTGGAPRLQCVGTAQPHEDAAGKPQCLNSRSRGHSTSPS